MDPCRRVHGGDGAGANDLPGSGSNSGRSNSDAVIDLLTFSSRQLLPRSYESATTIPTFGNDPRVCDGFVGKAQIVCVFDLGLVVFRRLRG